MTEAEYRHLIRKPQGQPAKPRRTRRLGARWGEVRSYETPDGWHLIFLGQLPRMNVQHPDWRKRWNLKQAGLRQFGILPQPCTLFAEVTITRVLGPGERLMDTDNFMYACKGAIDSLTNRWMVRQGKRAGTYRGGGNYIVDDLPTWARVTYMQDLTRREYGPMLEVRIVYV